MVRCKVTATVFVGRFPSPKINRTVKVLMAEDPVAILGSSVALVTINLQMCRQAQHIIA